MTALGLGPPDGVAVVVAGNQQRRQDASGARGQGYTVCSNKQCARWEWHSKYGLTCAACGTAPPLRWPTIKEANGTGTNGKDQQEVKPGTGGAKSSDPGADSEEDLLKAVSAQPGDR